jgi:hypothetical protein
MKRCANCKWLFHNGERHYCLVERLFISADVVDKWGRYCIHYEEVNDEYPNGNDCGILVK